MVAIAQVLTTAMVLLVYAQLQGRIARPLGQRADRARRLRDLGWGQRLRQVLAADPPAEDDLVRAVVARALAAAEDNHE